MILGLSANSFKRVTLQQILKICHETGIKNIELWDGKSYFEIPQKNTTEIAKWLKDEKIWVSSLHATHAYWDESAPQEYLTQFRRCCEKACIFDSEYVVAHPMRFMSEEINFEKSFAETMPESFALWQSLAEIAGTFGIDLAFENLSISEMWPSGLSLVDSARLVREIGLNNVGLCFDVAHSWGSGHDPLLDLQDSWNYTRNIYGLHVSDSLYKPSSDEHLIPGFGDVNWGQLFSLLYQEAFDGFLYLPFEVLPVQTEDVEKVIVFIQQIMRDAEKN